MIPRNDNGSVDWNSAIGIFALLGLIITIGIYLNL